MSGYAIHPEALLELEEISKYHEQFSESFAAKLRSELYAAFDLVVQFPRHGFFRSDLANSSVRFKLVREYLIAYTPESDPILMLAVFDGRRSPRILAASLRRRG